MLPAQRHQDTQATDYIGSKLLPGFRFASSSTAAAVATASASASTAGSSSGSGSARSVLVVPARLGSWRATLAISN